MNINIVDALHQSRGMTLFAKSLRKDIDKYIDTVELPEGKDSLTRGNIKIWFHHYIDGTCSFTSLKNAMTFFGVGDFLKEAIHEVEISEDGKLKLYEVKNDDE